jgi:hypothetical protein
MNVGDLVITGTPSDTCEEYHNQVGRVKNKSTGRPRYYVNGKDEEGNWTRDPVYTGPEYPISIVEFEDKSLDQKWLPFKDSELTKLERAEA